MAAIEQHDDILIIETSATEQAAIDGAMEKLNLTRDEMGGGIVLFLLDDTVVLRTRQVSGQQQDS